MMLFVSFYFQKQIVQFLWTQVLLHHPGGSLIESEGFWAHNDERWSEILRKIYKFVMKELKNASKNFSFTRYIHALAFVLSH